MMSLEEGKKTFIEKEVVFSLVPSWWNEADRRSFLGGLSWPHIAGQKRSNTLLIGERENRGSRVVATIKTK